LNKRLKCLENEYISVNFLQIADSCSVRNGKQVLPVLKEASGKIDVQIS